MVVQKKEIQSKYNISTFHNLKVNYWGIAKSGNTTIKYILLRAEKPKLVESMDNNSSKENMKNFHGNLHKGWVHQKCRYITPDQAKESGYKNFTVIRNPFDRTISMYYNLLQRPDRSFASGSDRFKKEMKMFIKTLTFIGFLEVLERFPDTERNIHYRSQKSYCLDENIIKLKLDNIRSTITYIHPLLKVDTKLNKSNDDIIVDEIIHQKIQQVFFEDIDLWKKCI